MNFDVYDDQIQATEQDVSDAVKQAFDSKDDYNIGPESYKILEDACKENPSITFKEFFDIAKELDLSR